MEKQQERLQLAGRLIKQQQYERARLILAELPDHPTAREWLAKLDQLDPQATNFEEAQAELQEIKTELAGAERELQTTQKEKKRAQAVSQRGWRIGTGLLVFFGSLFGSLLGVAADAGEVADNLQELRSYFDPTLCVVGSDTILGDGVGEAQAWADSFEIGRAVKVQIDAIGSGNGLRLAAEGGCAHVLAMSDPMSTEDEAALSAAGVEVACAAEIGYDVIVFITDINNPVRTIEDRDLGRILRGSISNWGSVSTAYPETITIYYRPGSGTTNVVLENLVNYTPVQGQPVPTAARYVSCESNEDCLNKTLTTPGSLYWVSAAWMETQPDAYLKVLEIAVNEQVTTDPRQEGFSLSRYPASLVRPLYMYVLDGAGTDAEQLGLGREFLDLVRGVEGQQILEQAHFYTHFNRPGQIQVPLPSGFAAFDDPARLICKD